ncbi:hypothetical protein [Pseudonocardia humida]|uniref:Lipoprotein n=1 Tax=Pseudonocardia humida TaxID=2800819 RepID=A0ABT1ABM2_9PSEU|nr:hypothetical protein [Pseudonocardia humida]MCO1660429.1 hypothetical protein [Pseudonocardia humida]
MNEHVGVGARGSAVVAVAVLVLSGCAGSPDPGTDEDVAFCLSRPQRQKLVDAAEALGIARAGATPGTFLVEGAEVPAATWRTDEPERFERACAAIRPDGPASEWTTGLIATVNVLVGAVLALGTSWLTARSTRRRQAGDALRAAAGRFVRSVEAFVLVRTKGTADGPTVASLLDQVGELDAAAWHAEALRRPGAAADTLLALDAVSAAIAGPWPDDRDDVTAHSREIAAAADRVRTTATALAAGLDRTWRPGGGA